MTDQRVSIVRPCAYWTRGGPLHVHVLNGVLLPSYLKCQVTVAPK